MKEFLEKLSTRVRVGVVGGSDLSKIKEQLGDDGEEPLYWFLQTDLVVLVLMVLVCQSSRRRTTCLLRTAWWPTGAGSCTLSR